MAKKIEPREYTTKEVQKKFLERMARIAQHWAKLPNKSVSERCNGVVFTILSEIDEGSSDLPAFILAPAPHPDEKEYRRKKGKNWFPENSQKVKSDIGGSLHELWPKFEPKEEL